MHWWPDGWWGGWFMMLIGMVFWVLLIVGLVFLIRWLAAQSGGREAGVGESAVEILRKRYARGEITREQYQEMRRDLEQSGSPG